MAGRYKKIAAPEGAAIFLYPVRKESPEECFFLACTAGKEKKEQFELLEDPFAGFSAGEADKTKGRRLKGSALCTRVEVVSSLA